MSTSLCFGVAGRLARHFAVLAIAVLLCSETQANRWHGAPSSRFYSFDDLQGVSAGVEISFDAFGRTVLMQNGTYLVLNDERWIEDLAPGSQDPLVRHVHWDSDGDAYFGSVGSWGRLQRNARGQLFPLSLVPDSCPEWAKTTEFTQIVPSAEGVCFGGWIGVAVWNRHTKQMSYVPVPEVARIFRIGDVIYVSSHRRGVQRLDVATGVLHDPEQSPFAGIVVEAVAVLGPTSAIFSTSDRRLLKYEKGSIAPLPGVLGQEMGGRITALAALPDGDVAVSVLGVGLYLISGEGEIRLFLSEIEYRDITALAANESGVVWAATQAGVAKILTRSPVSRFSRTNGLPVFWPQFAEWRDRLLVASNGHLYESTDSPAGSPASFRWFPDQPRMAVWGLAVAGDWLLVGNRDGLMAKKGDGVFEPVLRGMEVARLAMLESGICFAIGMQSIAVLRLDADGRWSECAPRATGIGYPSLVHVSRHAAWVEIGANLVGRISLEDGVIKARTINSFPWKDPRWIHASVLGDTVMLSGPEAGRVYFDEVAQEVYDGAKFEAVLSQLPGPWPARVAMDGPDTLWVAHARGVSRFRFRDGEYREEDSRFESVDCYIPQIHVVSEESLFLSTGREVFALEPPSPTDGGGAPPFQPRVIAAVDSSTGILLFPDGGFATGAMLPYQKNSFSLQLFAGSYAARRSPQYEFSVNGSLWAPLDGSVLPMTNLREGNYRMGIRMVDKRGPIGRVQQLRFAIAPPWWRTPMAYSLYAIAGAFGALAGMKIVARRVRRKNQMLEHLVREKTAELEKTMRQLEDEARTSATLAERNRLAGEIHDTLEQSLTALSLQLSSTASHPGCPAQVRTGLAIAQNMVVFSRNEVRNSVWDLHSPSVGQGGLVGALERLVDQQVPPPLRAIVTVEGMRRSVLPSIEHHLLRIAQEAVANTVKHAGAAHIVITVRYDRDGIMLAVQDDGCGFAVEAASALPAGHFGLRFMRARAEKIGGRIDICSAVGTGARIAATVPVPNTREDEDNH